MKRKILIFSVLSALFVGSSVMQVSAQDSNADEIGEVAVRMEEAGELGDIYIEPQEGTEETFEDFMIEDSDETELPSGYPEITRTKKAGEEPGIEATEDKVEKPLPRAAASSATAASSFTYKKLSDGTVSITQYTGTDTAVKIPNKLKGMTVTQIGAQAFINTDIQSVVIPEGVKTIGEAAFYGCGNLDVITLPKSLRKIEAGAFVYCYNLQKMNLNEGLQSIGDYAFQNTGIQSITIPSTLKTIGQTIFYGCTSFTGYAENKNPYFAVTSGVLYSNDKKTIVDYPTGKTASSYAMPSSVTTIKEAAFLGTYNLQKVVFGSNIKTIGDWAFSKSGLTEFSLPSTVTKIGNGIVSECPRLKKLTIKNTKLKALPYQLAYMCTSLETVYLSGKIEEIGQLDFAYCSSLKNVTLNSGLKIILNGAFGECTSLVSIKLPSGLEEIAYQAFMNDIKLTNVNIPSSVKAIYRQAFYNCPAWEQIKKKIGLVNVAGDVYQEAQTLKVTGQANYTYAYQVLSSVNKYRKAAGLKTLSMDQELLDAAMQRAAEISLYFDHNRPYGGACFEASDKMFGENIAAYQTSPASVMNSWMNSDGHRGNILSENYNCVGIGCFSQNGTYYWVQCFGWGDVKNAVKKSDSNKKFTIYATEEYVVPKLQLDTPTLKLSAQKRMTAYAGGTKLDADSFNWKSSNTLTATVSTSGLVKALAGGTANITITNKTMPSVKDSLKVTVNAPKYLVRFNPNGGSVSTTAKKVYKGNKYNSLPTASRKGYEFLGWYTAKSGGSKVASTTIVKKGADHTLYAQWKKTKYTVKYVTGGGTNNSKNPSAYYITSSTVTLKNPARKGYTFKGWYTSSTYKTKVTKITKGSIGNKTFYAKWSVNQYTIRYNKNGATSGSMTDTKSCKYNTSYTLKSNTFKRRGYSFAGWATSAKGTVLYKDKASVKNLTSTNGAIKTLYAMWKPITYKINYNLNGGKNNSSNPVGYKVSTSTINLKNPTRTGYTFKGWYTDSSYKTKITSIAKGSVGTKNLYAKWSPNIYSIHYDANGGTGKSMQDTVSCSYGTEYALRSNTYARKNYKFAGWNTKADGTGKTYNNLAKVKNLTSVSGRKVTLYAQWKPLITGLQFEKSVLEMEPGDTYQLIPLVTPADIKDVIITYSVAEADVVLVSKDGLITAAAPGECEIICSTTDGSDIQVPIKVIVKAQKVNVPDAAESEERSESQSNISDEFKQEASENDILGGTQTDKDETAGAGLDEAEDAVEPDPDKADTDKSDIVEPGRDVSDAADGREVIQVSTVEELAEMRMNPDADYELTADIDLNETEWIPVGDEINPFTGSLEGNNHTISGMVIKDVSHKYNGLFGNLKGSIRNVVLKGQIHMTCAESTDIQYAGGIAGYAEQADIINCLSYVSIVVENKDAEAQGTVCLGEIVGKAAENTRVENCINYKFSMEY